jgi:hypothetical protein
MLTTIQFADMPSLEDVEEVEDSNTVVVPVEAARQHTGAVAHFSYYLLLHTLPTPTHIYNF